MEETTELDTVFFFFCLGTLFPKYIVTVFVLEYRQAKLWNTEPVAIF